MLSVISCCGKAIPAGAFAGRIIYTIIFFLVSFVAWLFNSWAEVWFRKISVFKDVCTSGDCFGTLAVYRISFVLAAFHLIMAVITIAKVRKIQDGFWIFKLLFIVGGIIGSFFLPPDSNQFFGVYGWIALFASAIFIVVQLIYLVDFAHGWAENWIAKHEDAEIEGDKRWFWALLGVTAVLFLVAITGSILLYVFFVGETSESCSTNTAVITINLALCVLISFGSIHPKVQEVNTKSGLLQPAVISLYCTYLIFSAVNSQDGPCGNPFNTHNSETGSNISMALGAIFTILAVIYSNLNAASYSEEPAAVEEKQPLKEDADTDVEKGSSTEATAEEEPTYCYWKFHLVFAAGAMYIAMLFTDWSTIHNIGSSDPQVSSGIVAVWVKVVSSWICIALYIWTLVAPIVLPDREWS